MATLKMDLMKERGELERERERPPAQPDRRVDLPGGDTEVDVRELHTAT